MRTVNKITFILGCTLLASTLLLNTGYSQSEFRSNTGTIVQMVDDTQQTVENFASDNPTIIAEPAEGKKLAHVLIKKGTDESNCYAKKISYFMKSEEFLLEGDAFIQNNQDKITAPLKVHYQPQKNTMDIVGTPEKNAIILYHLEEGNVLIEAEVIQFTLIDKNGKKIIDKLQPPKKSKQFVFFSKDVEIPTDIFRKLSPPK
jgi:hypothetical protein